MTLFEAIEKRRSVRKFKDTPIPKGIIDEMLEAARLSPSGGNAQNYAFGVVTDNDLKMQLAQAAGNQMWIASAPVVITGSGMIESWVRVIEKITNTCREAGKPDPVFEFRYNREFSVTFYSDASITTNITINNTTNFAANETQSSIIYLMKTNPRIIGRPVRLADIL